MRKLVDDVVAPSGPRGHVRVADGVCGGDTDGRHGRDAHHGLGNMEERAGALGGSLTVRSASGRGTGVEAVVPVGSRMARVAKSDATRGDGRKGNAGYQDLIG